MKKYFVLPSVFLVSSLIIIGCPNIYTDSGDSNQMRKLDGNNWEWVSAGGRHNLALKSDGTLWSWGENSWGQLGDGTTKYKIWPAQIDSNEDWAAISAGPTHSMALKDDGTLWFWGNNIEDSNYIYSPTQIGLDSNWIIIDTAGYHALGIKEDGTLWAWGINDTGQLGDGTNEDRYTPVQIGNDNNWMTATAGASFSLALKTDGTLWGWGSYHSGHLGDEGEGSTTFEPTNSPVQIGLDDDWLMIEAGYEHSLALKIDSTLWAWGLSLYGQLGDGTTVTDLSYIRPIQVGNDNDWRMISAGAGFSLALKTDGTLWAWGSNRAGQLGDGTLTDKNVPVQIGSRQDWEVISAGYYQSLAINSDQTLWYWGDLHYNPPQYY